MMDDHVDGMGHSIRDRVASVNSSMVLDDTTYNQQPDKGTVCITD